jgi:hypothetical protein
MKRSGQLLLCAAVGLAVAIGTAVVARRWGRPAVQDWLRVSPDFVDVVERIDLELDLRSAPTLSASARMQLRPDTSGDVFVVLNRALRVDRALDETGRALAFKDLGRLRSDYFSEARAIAVTLAGPSRVLQLDYSGRGLDGSEGRDWMGILLLAPDELRMSVQTAFYPQIPSDLAGPGVSLWPARVRVLAPAGFEAYAPGAPCAWDDAPAGGRAWCFESESPTNLSLFAAPRVRRETRLGEASVVTLLTQEHAELGAEMATEIEQMLRFYADAWGPIGARTLGVVETTARGSSYSWAAQGIIALERGALSGRVPLDSLAHETAHLWWGQEVAPRGRGERLLTEGLAEYASWRYLTRETGATAANALAASAEAAWWQGTHRDGADTALHDVRFGIKGYSTLAYSKGPAALWRLHRRIGGARIDAVLRDYRARMQAGPSDADAAESFAQAVRAHAGLEQPEVELALFENAGHVHATLDTVVFDGGTARGRLRREPCPAGIAPPDPLRARVTGLTQADRVVRVVEFGSATSVPFELQAAQPLLAVRVDLDGMLSTCSGSPVPRSDVGFMSSEPPDGARDLALGRLEFRLRYGHALTEAPSVFREQIESACRQAGGRLSILSFSLRDDGHTLVVELDGTLPESEHVLVIPEGLVTRSGIPLGEQRLRFRTRDAGDLPRPRVVSTEPAHGARDVPADLKQLKLVFSEPMRPGYAFRKSDSDELARQGLAYPPLGSGGWIDERTLVFELQPPLEPGRRYGLAINDSLISRLGLRHERIDLHFETRP